MVDSTMEGKEHKRGRKGKERKRKGKRENLGSLNCKKNQDKPLDTSLEFSNVLCSGSVGVARSHHVETESVSEKSILPASNLGTQLNAAKNLGHVKGERDTYCMEDMVKISFHVGMVS